MTHTPRPVPGAPNHTLPSRNPESRSRPLPLAHLIPSPAMGLPQPWEYRNAFDWVEHAAGAQSPPPPADWRSRPLDSWRGRDWSTAQRDMNLEHIFMTRIVKAVSWWAAVLAGVRRKTTRHYWPADLAVLPNRTVYEPSRRMEMLACPGSPGMSTPLHDAQPPCGTWWPPGGHSCVVYVIGVGDLGHGGHGDAWGLSKHAAVKRGCRVHAYDPTTTIRARHEAGAAKIRSKLRSKRAGNVSFHFAGLGDGARATTNNSYGTVDGMSLYTLSELAARNPEGERHPTVLSIDCEGCEWAALSHIGDGGDPQALRLLQGVKLLLLDAHLSPTMRAPTPQQFVRVMELLFHRLRFKLRWLRSVNGYPLDQHIADFLAVGGLPVGFCCYEMALVRE